MARGSIINPPSADIGEAMREIQQREGRGAVNKAPPDERFMMEVLPFHQAPVGVISLIRCVGSFNKTLFKVGARCSNCPLPEPQKVCRCFTESRPTHWINLPRDWIMRERT